MLPASIVLAAALLAGSIVFLATRLSRVFSITVQAPTALLPERVQTTLDALDAKLAPAQVKLDALQVRELVQEGVAMAELSKLKGPDRFRIAREYVLGRAASLNAEVPPDLAQCIEASVASRRKK